MPLRDPKIPAFIWGPRNSSAFAQAVNGERRGSERERAWLPRLCSHAPAPAPGAWERMQGEATLRGHGPGWAEAAVVNFPRAHCPRSLVLGFGNLDPRLKRDTWEVLGIHGHRRRLFASCLRCTVPK